MRLADSLERLSGTEKGSLSRKGRERRRAGYHPPLRPRFEFLEQRVSPAVLAIDPVHLTVNGSPNTIYGAPFTASVVDGVARFDIASDLSVAEGDTIVVGPGRAVSLVIGGGLELPAGSALDSAADALTIQASGTVNLAGSVVVGGSLSVSGQTVINSGAIHADGGVGGTIAIQAASFQNSGRITADGTGGAGGTVRVAFTGSYVETTSGLIAADGAGGAGGRVTIDGERPPATCSRAGGRRPRGRPAVAWGSWRAPSM